MSLFVRGGVDVALFYLFCLLTHSFVRLSKWHLRGGHGLKLHCLHAFTEGHLHLDCWFLYIFVPDEIVCTSGRAGVQNYMMMLA